MNYYDILGVRKNASQEEIKNSYKKLIKKYHPDIYKGDKTFAEKKTSEINVAYETLCNEETRKEYDEKISPTPNYSYTPPKYDTNYETKKYYSNYDNYTSTRDGSEHDYSTYANYSRYNTDYHRSRTPNSNFSKAHDNFSDNLINNFDKMSASNKIKVIMLVLTVYVIALIFSVAKFQSLFDNNSNDNTLAYSSHTNSLNNPQNNRSNYSNNNNYTNSNSYENKTDNQIDNSSDESTNSFYIDNILSKYFSEEELQDLYSEFQDSFGDSISFEEFKSILAEYIKTYNSYY